MAKESRAVRVTVEDRKIFNVSGRMKKALETLEKEFKEYEITNINISVGFEAGIPSGVTGSVQVTLAPKKK